MELRLPAVTPNGLQRWIEGLCQARAELLADRPIASILRALDRVVGRFLDPADPARRAAVESLQRAGRFPQAMTERALDDAFAPLAHGGLKRWLASELGSAGVLDRPSASGDGTLRLARGPEWMLQVYAGNVPTVPIWPLLSAPLLKSALLAKTSSQEPVLAPLLARTVAQEDADLGHCMAVVWWKGGTGELDRTALALAPAVLAFGGDVAMASVARQARPGAALVVHGPKVSVGYVGSHALSRAALGALAARAALDVALYDQQGCLSPHAYYVERGGAATPSDFAAALGEALEGWADKLPRREPSAAESASIQMVRAQARFEAGAAGAAGDAALRAPSPSRPPGSSPAARDSITDRARVSIAGRAPGSWRSKIAAAVTAHVLGSPRGTHWTVLCENGARFEPGPTHRTVRVHAIDGPEDFERAVGPEARYVEALALEEVGARRAALAARFAAIGVPRITTLGRLQRPSPLGTHGGIRRLLPFVTWSTVETEKPRARKSASRSSTKGSRRGARSRARSR
jgi:hypothetical protein